MQEQLRQQAQRSLSCGMEHRRTECQSALIAEQRQIRLFMNRMLISKCHYVTIAEIAFIENAKYAVSIMA